MENLSAENQHVHTHNTKAASKFPPNKLASEDSKPDFSTRIAASELDYSQRNQEASYQPIVDDFSEKRASECSADDFSSKKNACVRIPELQNRASELQITRLSTEKQASELTTPGLLPSVMGRLGANGDTSAKFPRAEIDTAAPFESMKAAATLFGENMDRKSQVQVLDRENKLASGLDGEKANEDYVLNLKRLHEEETSIAGILLELEKAKKQIHTCKGRVPGVEEAFNPSNQSEALDAKNSYVSVLHELEMARKEIEGVNEELVLLESLKQVARQDCVAASRARDAASERVNQLMAEQASSQEVLAAAKATRAAIDSEIGALRSGYGAQFEGKPMAHLVQASNTKMARLSSLELDLGEVGSVVAKLKEELATRNAKSKASSAVHTSEALMNEELKQAKVTEGELVVAIGKVLEELDTVKLSLSKATQSGTSLTSAVAGLQAEVAKRQVELESAHETEQIACATLASLQDELCSIRALVSSAYAGETKARVAKRTFPMEIKQLASEADEAKVASRLAQKEARKSTLELEQFKASMTTAESRLQAALKDTQAARASEAMAVAEFKALSESVGEEHDSKEGSEGKEGAVNISVKEYKALTDAVHEAEEAANKKVAAVLVEVEAARASEKGAQAKLDASVEDIEALRKSMEEAEKKADDAQAAKLSVEAELRKWRAEHEQWRKTGSNPSSVNTSAAQSPRLSAKKPSSQRKVIAHASFHGNTTSDLDSLAEVLSLKVPAAAAEKNTSAAQSPRVNRKKASSHGKIMTAHASFHGKTASDLDSLAEVLSLKVPVAEKIVRDLPMVDVLKKVEKAKKPSFFSRVMSMIARKKDKSSRYVTST